MKGKKHPDVFKDHPDICSFKDKMYKIIKAVNNFFKKLYKNTKRFRLKSHHQVLLCQKHLVFYITLQKSVFNNFIQLKNRSLLSFITLIK